MLAQIQKVVKNKTRVMGYDGIYQRLFRKFAKTKVPDISYPSINLFAVFLDA